MKVRTQAETVSAYTIEVEEHGLRIESAEVVAECGPFALVEVATEKKYVRSAASAAGNPREVWVEDNWPAFEGFDHRGYARIRIATTDGRPRMTVTESCIRYGVIIAVAPDVANWESSSVFILPVEEDTWGVTPDKLGEADER